MYQFYRFFAERGHAADFIHILDKLPARLRDFLPLARVRASHR